MNKYLLLRDNKQSGPYTVPELIAKGIKAYDLVWLEGKSAAWRYPGEIDELKEHAPLVEEQPFDRFYKKPEAEPSPVSADTHARYQPSVSIQTSEENHNKRIYVNFPAKGSEPSPHHPGNPVRPPQFRDRTISSPAVQNIEPQLPVVNGSIEKEPLQMAAAPPSRRAGNQRNPLTVIAAIVALVAAALVIYLFVNFYQQRKSINELNAHIQQLEQRNQQTAQQNQQSASLLPPPAEVTNVPPPTDVAIEEPFTEEPSISSERPAKRAAAASGNSRHPISGDESGVIFTEHKRTPAEEKVASAPSENTSSAEPENLFKLVNVSANKYKTGVLGGISNLQLELNNASTKDLQRVSVEIKYLGPEKRVVKTHTVQFSNVAAGSQVTLDVPKSNRGVTIEYAIIDIKS